MHKINKCDGLFLDFKGVISDYFVFMVNGRHNWYFPEREYDTEFSHNAGSIVLYFVFRSLMR